MPRTAVYRHEVHSEEMPIEQKADLIDGQDRDPEIVEADASVMQKDYLNELAFNEEPVTIRLEPFTEKNAANVYPVWCQGKGAEVLMNGKWYSITYLPVGMEITIKRKYLAVIASSKLDQIETQIIEHTGENPENKVRRSTSAGCAFSVLEDRNPRGHSWLTELRRRNM